MPQRNKNFTQEVIFINIIKCLDTNEGWICTANFLENVSQNDKAGLKGPAN